MKNPATHVTQGINEFTAHIMANPKTVVKLRNGVMIEPVVFMGEDHWEDDFEQPRGFQDGDWNYCWNLDGTSVTNHRFDMMEIIS